MSELLTKSEVLNALAKGNYETLDDIVDKVVSQSNGKVEKKDIFWALQTGGITSLDDIAQKAVAAVNKQDQSKLKKTVSDGAIHVDV